MTEPMTNEQLECVGEELSREGGELYCDVSDCLRVMGEPYASADHHEVARRMYELWSFGKCAQCGRFMDDLFDNLCEPCRLGI